MTRTTTLVTALGLTLALGAPGWAGAAELRWKFKPGEALHYQMGQTTVQQSNINNQQIKTTNTQTIDMTWKVASVARDGTAEMTQTIDRIRTKIESPFGTFDYDSKSDKTPEGPIAAGMVPVLKALAGASFQYKISPRGELTDIRVPDSLVKTLKDASPAANATGMFSEEGLKNMINESSLVLPAGDLAPGKSWERPTKLPPSPIGVMALDKTYTYEGPGDGGEKIRLKVTMKLEPAADNKLDIKIASQEGKGTFVFDNAAGRVVKSNVSQKLDMTISVMNQQITQNVETTTSMKLVDAGGGQ